MHYYNKFYLRSFSPSDPEGVCAKVATRRPSANLRSDSEALAGRFHPFGMPLLASAAY